jgi:sirohydrochlorin ferrochelatase
MPAFLDDSPEIEEVARSLTTGGVIIIPFLIGRGLHGAVDIADRFGLKVSQAELPPLERNVGGCRIVLDLPIGSLPEIQRLVTELAHAALGELEQAETQHA